MTTYITRTIFKSLNNLVQITKTSKCNQATVRFSSTYRAAVIAKKGAKELTFEDLKRPKLKDTEVRVAVAYCSVNIHDVHSFDEPSAKKPFVPGYEFSGEIIETGKEAGKLFKTEDRVVALSQGWGGLATECVVDYENIWMTPACLKLPEAATIPYTYGAALYAFGVLSPINEKSNVVIAVGAAGGGLAAVEVASNTYKAKVIAVTDTELESELTRQKGALRTLHYNDNVAKYVKKIYGDNMADVVYDAVGDEVHDVVGACVGYSGKIFVLRTGKVNAPKPHASLMHVSLIALREKNLIEYRQIIQDTLDLADQGHLTPHISEKFDFEDVNEAVDFIVAKKCHGKIVVKMN